MKKRLIFAVAFVICLLLLTSCFDSNITLPPTTTDPTESPEKPDDPGNSDPSGGETTEKPGNSDQTEHKHTEVIDPAVAPKCTEAGKTEGKHCSECGTVIVAQETVSALGHDKKEHAAKAPTCTEKGWNAYEACLRCDYTTYAEVPAKGHKNQTIPAVDATCTENGSTAGEKCSECGEILKAPSTVTALGHDEKDNSAKAPTCTEKGWNAYVTCSRCDYTTYSELPAKGHKAETIPAVDVSCTVNGATAGEKCSVCEKILKAPSDIPASGHDFDETDTCNVCGQKNSDHVHIEEIKLGYSPTCIESGLTDGKYCTVCGDVTVAQTVIPALGHDSKISISAVASTCTATGLTEGKKCSVCGEMTVKQTVTSKLEHDQKITLTAVEATCTTSGLTEGKKCSGCDKVTVTQDILPPKGHKDAIDPAVAATCTTSGLTQGKHCSVCGFVITAQTTVPAKGHKDAIDPAVAATCTTSGKTEGKHCSVCGFVITVQTTVPAKGHTNAIDAAVAATCTTGGKTEGKHCSVCGFIITPQTVIPAKGHTKSSSARIEATWSTDGRSACIVCSVCKITLSDSYTLPKLSTLNSRYGYDYFGTMEKGSALQALYNELASECEKFHNGAEINATDNIVATLDYSAHGLTKDDASAVLNIFRNDNPLYYWIDSKYGLSNSLIQILCVPDYANGNVRVAKNEMIYNAVWDLMVNETSPYLFALAYHDAILEGMTYAFESDGVTPSTDHWAHSIIGFFEKETGVCESYSRAFQIMLNYSGVENIFVTGYAGGGEHAWNMAKMDDGKWYWFDLTWDDDFVGGSGIGGWKWGINYNYFCVNDTQNTLWCDGGWGYNTTETFISTHFFELPTNTGIRFLYALPDRSSGVFAAGSVPAVGTQFTSGSGTYAVVGYNAVELRYISDTGNVVIPKSVSYLGREFEVISVGNKNDSGFFVSPILSDEAISVTLHEGIKFIWDGAFCSKGLQNIYVSGNNPYFTSRDGVLFTKSLYTLIQYPSANTRTKYIIPNETAEIAYLAFRSLKSLGSLELGSGVRVVGRMNFGNGYFDIDEGVTDIANYQAGELADIMTALTLSEITVNSSNKYFTVNDGIVYNKAMTVLIAVPRTKVGNVVIPNTVKVIDQYAFMYCLRITNITIPKSIESIGAYAFFNCYSIQTIKFEGTMAEWNAIPKGQSWNEYTLSYSIQCSDGTITK